MKLNDSPIQIELFDTMYDVNLFAARYDNGRIAIEVICLDGEPFGRASVNIEKPLGDNEIFVKNWSENVWVSQLLTKTNFFTDTGKKVPTGHVMAPVWLLSDELLKKIEAEE